MKPRYKHLCLYYFSGTGNARKVAYWIGKQADKDNFEHVEILNIEKKKALKYPETGKDTLVGIIAPTHGFNFPPVVLNFLIRFPRLQHSDAFIINTRAGMKLHKWFLPGLSGLAQYLAAIILKIKGLGIVGMQPMDMPSNWISLHPGLKKSVVDSIVERCHSKTMRFAHLLFSGKTRYKAWYSLPFDLLVAPIAVLYYFMGRFMLAKTFVATDKCNNCGLCEKQCPVNAIKTVNDRPYWTFDCESCMRCMNSCPHRAIETAHLFAGLVWWAAYWGVAAFLLIFWNKLTQNLTAINPVVLDKGFEIIRIIFVFLGTYIAYRVMHLLMRYRIFAMFIRFTSLTNFKFWRRYRLRK